MLETLTNFGDAAVLLPLSGILFLWLLAARPVRAALAWAAALTVCNGVLAVLKVYFFACPLTPSLHSPSGHTGFSVMVYGGLAVILALETRSRRRRIAIVAGGVAATVSIAVSRLLLGVHTVTEVALGALIGAACLAGFAQAYRRQHRAGEWLPLLGLAVLAVIVLFGGDRAGIENFLHRLSVMMGIREAACGGRAG
jgi:membrane-associated phospholipid phosphatase